MKKTPFLFLTVLLLCACSKEPIYELTGTWKLTKVNDTQNTAQLTHDYAPYNVIYEFKAGDVLTVSGKTNQIEAYIGHEEGDHFYTTQKIYVLDDKERTKLSNTKKMLIIGDIRYMVTFIDGKNSWYYLGKGENGLLITDNERYTYVLTKVE